VVAYFPMFFGLLLAAAAVLPVPCASTTSDCTEWIKPAGQQSRVLVYRTHPFEKKTKTSSVHLFLFMPSSATRTIISAPLLPPLSWLMH